MVKNKQIKRPAVGDAVGVYLREMGKHDLLTKEGEVLIFKRIEKAQKKALNLLCEDSGTLIRFSKLGHDLLEGRERFEDSIDCSGTKEKFMKGLHQLVMTLDEGDHPENRRRTLYKRFYLKQSLIDGWCESIKTPEMLKTLEELDVIWNDIKLKEK